MTKRFLSALCLLSLAASVSAQGGEGNNTGAFLETRVNGSAYTLGDKAVAENDILDIRVSTTLLAGQGPAVLFGLFDNFAPKPMFDFSIELGVLGFDPSPLGATGILYNGFGGLGGVVGTAPGLSNEVTFTVSIPPFSGALEDFTIQSIFFDLTLSTLPLNFAISNTVRHSTTNVFSDVCADAAGLSREVTELALGFPLFVDTRNFTNTLETSGLVGIGGTTMFSLMPPGMGVTQQGPDTFTRFFAATGGTYRFDLCGSFFNSDIYLIDTDCTTVIVGNESGTGCPQNQARLDFPLAPGQRVIIVIDGFSLAEGGPAQLIISLLP